MSRSFIHLRRVLFGVSCAVVFGAGATQALGSPDLARRKACPTNPELPYPYYSDFCAEGCVEGVGYCGTDSECHCGYFD